MKYEAEHRARVAEYLTKQYGVIEPTPDAKGSDQWDGNPSLYGGDDEQQN